MPTIVILTEPEIVVGEIVDFRGRSLLPVVTAAAASETIVAEIIDVETTEVLVSETVVVEKPPGVVVVEAAAGAEGPPGPAGPSFTGSLDGPFYLTGPRPYISPLHNYYGAIGDGVVDDTTALQNSLDDARDVSNGSIGRNGAEVRLDGGTYRITDTLHARVGSDTWQRGIAIIGAGNYFTVILSEGPGVALAIEGQKFVHGGRFSLINTSGSRGSTTGIEFTGGPGNPVSGTATNGLTYDMLYVEGYNVGIHLGEGQYEGSELVFDNLTVTNNNVGVLGNGFNNLDFVFTMLKMAGNGIGIDCGAASNFLINGAGISEDGIDFYVHGGGTFTSINARAELYSDRHIVAMPPSVAPLGLLIINPLLAGKLNTDGGSIFLYRGCSAVIQGGNIDGSIFVDAWADPSSTRLSMHGVTIRDTVPFRPQPGRSLEGLTAEVINCKRGDESGFVIGDFPQLIGATYDVNSRRVGGLSIRQGGQTALNGALPSPKVLLPPVATDLTSTMALANALRSMASLTGLATPSTATPPFSPLQLAANCELWFSADQGVFLDPGLGALSTIAGDPGGGWQDRSGNGRHVIQTIVGQQPTYQPNIINGLPVLQFDGTDDRLLGVMGGITDEATIFVVAKFNVLTWFQFLLDLAHIHNSTNTGLWLGSFNETMVFRAEEFSETAYVFSDTTDFNVHTAKHTTAARSLYLNGGSPQSTQSTAQTITDPILFSSVGGNVGDSQFLNGYIAEIIVYSSALSSADQTLVQAYLGSKYSLTVTTTP